MPTFTRKEWGLKFQQRARCDSSQLRISSLEEWRHSPEKNGSIRPNRNLSLSFSNRQFRRNLFFLNPLRFAQGSTERKSRSPQCRGCHGCRFAEGSTERKSRSPQFGPAGNMILQKGSTERKSRSPQLGRTRIQRSVQGSTERKSRSPQYAGRH